jgi:hypothetical protein
VIRTLWAKLIAWLRAKSFGWIEGVMVAFVGAALFAGVGALAKHPGVKLQLWVVIVVAVAALGLGGLGGFLGSQGAGTSDEDDARRKDIEFKRLSAYTAHFRNLLGSFLSNELSLAEFLEDSDEQIGKVICELPAHLIRQATGYDVKISLWMEKSDDAGERKFEVVFDGDHSGKEIRQFNKINLDSSWIHHSGHRRECNPGESPILRMNLADASDGSSDVRAFRSMGYRDGRAFGVAINDQPVRLVALSKQEDTFSELEDFFLILLWCALTIAEGPVTDDGDLQAEGATA